MPGLFDDLLEPAPATPSAGGLFDDLLAPAPAAPPVAGGWTPPTPRPSEREARLRARGIDPTAPQGPTATVEDVEGTADRVLAAYGQAEAARAARVAAREAPPETGLESFLPPGLAESFGGQVPSREFVVDRLRRSEGLPGVLPQQGILASGARAFGSAALSALSELTATAPVPGSETLGRLAETIQTDPTQFAPSTFAERTAAGIGASLPALAETLVAARAGRTAALSAPGIAARIDPTRVNQVAQALAAGSVNFKSELDQNPNDIAGALRRSGIELVATFLGGRGGVEALSRGRLGREMGEEALEEGLTGAAQAADQLLISEGRPLDRQTAAAVAEAGAQGAVAGPVTVGLLRPAEVARSPLDLVRALTGRPEVGSAEAARADSPVRVPTAELSAPTPALPEIAPLLIEPEMAALDTAQLDAIAAEAADQEAAVRAAAAGRRLERRGGPEAQDTSAELAAIQAARAAPQETSYAQEVRSDAGRLPREGAPREGSQVQGRPDLQQPAETQRTEVVEKISRQGLTPEPPAALALVSEALQRGEAPVVSLPDGGQGTVVSVDPDAGTAQVRLPGAEAPVETPLDDLTPVSPARAVEAPAAPAAETPVAPEFVVRRPQGRGTVEGTVTRRVGNAHAVVELPSGEFIVAATSRHDVATARRRGTSVPLRPVDPALGRGLRRGEKHSGRSPTTYATQAEAVAAAEQADQALGEPEDVLGGRRKAAPAPTEGPAAVVPREAAKAIAGAEGVSIAHSPAPLAEDLADTLVEAAVARGDQEALAALAKAEQAATPQERAQQLQAVQKRLGLTTKAGRVAARQEAAQRPQEEGFAFAEALNPHLRRLIDAPPSTSAEVAQAYGELERVIGELAAGSSAIQTLVASRFGTDSPARRALAQAERLAARAVRTQTPEATAAAETAARRAGEVIVRQGAELAATVMRMQRVEDLRAAVPLLNTLTARQGAAAYDGLSRAERDQTLEKVAEAFGLTLVRSGPLRIGRKKVASFYDAASGRTHLGPVSSVQEGVARLAHEAIHAELERFGSKERAALLDAVATALGDRADLAVKDIEKRWGSALPDIESAALHEALADAGAEAALSNRNNLLGILPPALGKRLQLIFRRLGQALRRVLRSLPGLRKLTGAPRDALVDLAERLLRVRVQRAQAVAATHADVVSFAAADLARATNAEEIERAVELTTRTGDLHQAMRSRFAAPGGRGLAAAVQRTSVNLWADALRVARAFPLFNTVLRGVEAADRQWHALIQDVGSLLDPIMRMRYAERQRVGGLMFGLRQENIRFREAEGRSMTSAEGETWLRANGAKASDLPTIASVHQAFARMWDARRASAAAMLGLSRPLSAAETRELIADYHAQSPEVQNSADLDRLQTWLEASNRLEETADPFYVPFVRLSNDDEILVTQRFGATERVVHRETSAAKRTAERVATLRSEYPGSRVESRPMAKRAYSDDSPDPLLQRLRNALSRSPVFKDARAAEADEFLEALAPALLAGPVFGSLRQARGIPGFDTDVLRVYSEYVGAVSNSIRRMHTLSNTRATLEQLNKDTKRPVLYEFAHDFVLGSGGGEKSDFSGPAYYARQATTARVLVSPGIALADTISSFTFTPFILADLTGKIVGPLGRAYHRTLQSAWDLLLLGLPKEMIRIVVDAPGLLIERMADRVGAPAAAALRRAARETDVLDSDVSQYRSLAYPGLSRAATKLAQGATAMQTATGRAARLATFVAAFESAAAFTPKDWAKVRARGFFSEEQPYEFAVWATQHVHGAYGKKYRPPIFRGPVGSVAFQFLTWTLNATRNVAAFSKNAVQDARKGDLRSLGLLLGMSGLGVVMHGIAAGVPIYGKAFGALASALLGVFGDDEDWDELMTRKTGEAVHGDQASLAFLLRTLHHGVFEALAGTQNIAARAVGELGTPLAQRAAPRGLVFDTLIHPRVAAARTLADIGQGVLDVKEGAAAGNQEAIRRGFARMLSPLALRWLQGLEALRPSSRGLTSVDIAEPGKPARTVVPEQALSLPQKITAAVTLALGEQPKVVQDAIRRGSALRDARNAQDTAVAAHIDAVVGALRANDTEGATAAFADLGAFIADETDRLRTAASPEERARILAELGWLLSSKNPGRTLKTRIVYTYLQREFGVYAPFGAPGGPSRADAQYRELLDAAAGTFPESEGVEE